MDSSHVAAGTITALLATVLMYLSHWPWQPLDLPTASAFAGLIVAAAAGAVKFYQSRTHPPPAAAQPEPIPAPQPAPGNIIHQVPPAA